MDLAVVPTGDLVRVTGPDPMAALLRSVLTSLAILGERLPPLEVAIARDGRNALGLVNGAVLWSIPLPRAQWLEILVGQVVATVTTLLDRLLFVHAGAVAVGGHGWVLVGKSGFGKTSSVAALLARQGVVYLSDEVALIDPDGGTVLPFTLPMAFKPWTLGAIQTPPPGHDVAREGRVTYRLPARRASVPAPVNTFVLLARGRRPCLTPVSPATMLLELARHHCSLRHHHRIEEAFAGFARTLRAARCLKLAASCPAACVDLLLEATCGQPSWLTFRTSGSRF